MVLWLFVAVRGLMCLREGEGGLMYYIVVTECASGYIPWYDHIVK